MLVFDQLNKDDRQLRFLAAVVLGGLLVLLGGLWWVQLISSRRFQEKLDTQAIRTIRIPAVRGKILDCEGRALAENRPSYNVNLYFDELSRNYQSNYTLSLAAAKKQMAALREQKQRQLGRALTKQEARQFSVGESIKTNLQEKARFEVTREVVADLSARLDQPVEFTEKEFKTRYDKARYLTIPLIAGLNPAQLARFEEQSAAMPGLDLEVQSMRVYPYGTVAAHLLGYLTHNDKSSEAEQSDYSYRLTDYEGMSGLEGLYDDYLRGTGGEKQVVVNNLGYRQSESMGAPSEPGDNLVLTVDLDIQKAAEAALQAAQANVRGAVVVMDAQNGDVLAMASAPNYDPNHRIHPDPATKPLEDERWSDEALGLQRNRAIYENYHPGSIFKIVVAMAALELNAFDPHTNFTSLGYFMVGRRKIGDTAKAGEFNFERAMAKSSNPYFCDLGLRPGVLPKIIELGERLHLGEKTGIMPKQEARGNFPTLKRIASNWRDGDTANLSIGQGEIDVTAIQVAVMTAAVANGGKVFWPRIVSRIVSADGAVVESFPAGRVRDNLRVSARTLRVLRQGMLADTEDPEGTGHLLKIPGWRIPGKTGTAQVEHNGRTHDVSAQDTWFVSYAPEESPRYVVVATVEGGASGGLTCVPIAHKVYLALQERERKLAARKGALAFAQ